MNKEHFIPISTSRLIADLVANHPHEQQLQQILNLIYALYQHTMSTTLNKISHYYEAFNPDLELITKTIDGTERKQHKTQLIQQVRYLLERANYTQLSIAEIEHAINTQPNLGLNISVDISDYEFFDIYYRGNSTRQIMVRKWLKKVPKTIDIYQRLFIVAKLKDRDLRIEELSKTHNISLKKASKKLAKTYKKLPKEVHSGQIFFKIFKDIPHLDLEMLFFVQKIKLRFFDKIRLIVAGGVSTTTGVISTITKVLAAFNPVTILLALVGFGAIIFKQLMGLFNQHTKYMQTLSKNLYFHNLNNNLGAVQYIGHQGIAEEIKEAILGYVFILSNPSLSTQELDTKIESYLKNTYQLDIDFEIKDSLYKLSILGLLSDEEMKVMEVKSALTHLNRMWDDIFVEERPLH